MNWYYARGGQQFGPMSEEQLKSMAAAGQLFADDLVWREGMADWQPAAAIASLYSGPGGWPGPPPMPRYDESKRIAAGVLAILLGSFGIHKFYLGMTGAGVIMLLASICTCSIALPVMHVIGIIEGIIYLSKSDADFHQTYVVEKKPWF